VRVHVGYAFSFFIEILCESGEMLGILF